MSEDERERKIIQLLMSISSAWYSLDHYTLPGDIGKIVRLKRRIVKDRQLLDKLENAGDVDDGY